MDGDGAVSAYNNAVEAAEWCRKKDDNGDTNFQRVLRWANAAQMERGRTAITASEIRARFHMKNAHSSSIMRWIAMADWTLCHDIRLTHVEEIDSEENRADFAALFKGFGVKPTSTDHIDAKKRWREYEKAMNGGNNAS